MDDLFPPRTHEPVDLEVIWELGDAIDEAIDETDGPGRVDHDFLAAIATSKDVPVSHLYVAAGLDPELPWHRTQEVTFVVCSGTCQGWGAVDVLEALLGTRDQRLATGDPVFDVECRACLDVCLPDPPYMLSESPHGRALHPAATPSAVAEAIRVLVDDR